MSKPRIAIFPGSFDPLTSGHLDLLIRGSRLVDNLIVAILQNTQKQALFSIDERMEMIRGAIVDQATNIEVDAFGGLLVDYAAKRQAHVVLRGIRGIADYENESHMALINRQLRPETETLFLVAGEAHSHISSRMVKEIYLLGGDASHFVPPNVAKMLRAKLGKTDRRA